jgi:hypothetical protein
MGTRSNGDGRIFATGSLPGMLSQIAQARSIAIESIADLLRNQTRFNHNLAGNLRVRARTAREKKLRLGGSTEAGWVYTGRKLEVIAEI